MRMVRLALVALAFALLSYAPSGMAQTRPATPAGGESRIALVVGISNYGAQSLENASSDAELVAHALRAANFETQTLIEPTKGQLRQAVNAITELARERGPNTTIAFFFAGHAVQFEGYNYLLPSGTDLFEGSPTVADYEDQSVSAQWVLDKLSETGVARVLLVLDACRTNPFRPDRRSTPTDSGLARMAITSGGPDTMIVFAAEPRFAALDGDPGANSYFSRAFAETISLPGLDVSEVFNAVRERVRAETRDRQRPHVEGLFRFTFTAGAAPSITTGSQLGITQARFNSAEDGTALLNETLRTRTVADLQTAADNGDGYAMYLLGLAHWDGAGGATKDIDAARRLMRRAISRGVGRAATSLGYIYCCGVEGQANDAEAVEWYRIGVELGAPGSMRNLATSYRDGVGVTQNLEEAERLYLRAGEEGLPVSYYLLAWIYRSPEYNRVNIERARTLYETAFERGYVDAANELGSLFEHGSMGEPNLQRAADYYRQGGEAGCRGCWFSLGSILNKGVDGTPDNAAAYQAYLRGAQAGDLDSMKEVARALRNGTGVAENDSESYRWYQQAAEAGDLEARGFAAVMLAEGEGVRRDPNRAAQVLTEIVANDLNADPQQRFRVYEPNYWRFGQVLATLHEERAIRNASAEEATRLRDRYARPVGMKRFTVPIDCAGIRTPFHVYILDWNRPDDETIEGQAEWVRVMRGCTFPADVLESFKKLKAIARENNVVFTDLAVYALGAAQNQATAPVRNTDGTVNESFNSNQNTTASDAVSSTQSPATNTEPVQIDEELLQERVVILLQGASTEGNRIYTYLQLSLERLQALRDVMRAGADFNPADYGTIVASGEGEPSAEVRERMAREHNMIDVPRPGASENSTTTETTQPTPQ